MREAAGLLEMTPMAKFEVSGPGAEDWLDGILANRPPRAPGRIALCHLLTARGTVRCELTVTRLSEDLFYLVATPRGERHDFDVLSRALPRDGSVSLRNATGERGCFTVVGPRAREVLQPIAEGDLGNDALPWLRARTMTVGFASDVRVLRIAYEGELGFELYHPIGHQIALLDTILEAGEGQGLRLAGYRAIESLRLDKSYRAMYRDLDVEHSALEAGLDRFVKLDGNRDFVGRAALERQRAAGLERRLVTLKVDTKDADAWMNEGVYASGGGPLVGRVTSGAYSHTLGHSLSMAYLGIEHSRPGTALEIPLLGERRPAKVIEDSPYDPANRRPRM